MRITDLLALIAFPGIVLNSIYIAWQIIGSLRVQFKHGILLHIVLPVATSVLSLGSAITLLFYNRVNYTTQGLPTPQWVTDTISYIWFALFLSLSGITYLFVTNGTKKYFPVGKKRSDR